MPHQFTTSQRYEEAAQHILDALVLQERDELRVSENKDDVSSSTLWDSLKTCCFNMQRMDLAAMCDYQDLEGLCLFSGSYNIGVGTNLTSDRDSKSTRKSVWVERRLDKEVKVQNSTFGCSCMFRV